VKHLMHRERELGIFEVLRGSNRLLKRVCGPMGVGLPYSGEPDEIECLEKLLLDFGGWFSVVEQPCLQLL
jgi:hypothetical protein